MARGAGASSQPAADGAEEQSSQAQGKEGVNGVVAKGKSAIKDAVKEAAQDTINDAINDAAKVAAQAAMTVMHDSGVQGLKDKGAVKLAVSHAIEDVKSNTDATSNSHSVAPTIKALANAGSNEGETSAVKNNIDAAMSHLPSNITDGLSQLRDGVEDKGNTLTSMIAKAGSNEGETSAVKNNIKEESVDGDVGEGKIAITSAVKETAQDKVKVVINDAAKVGAQAAMTVMQDSGVQGLKDKGAVKSAVKSAIANAGSNEGSNEGEMSAVKIKIGEAMSHLPGNIKVGVSQLRDGLDNGKAAVDKMHQMDGKTFGKELKANLLNDTGSGVLGELRSIIVAQVDQLPSPIATPLKTHGEELWGYVSNLLKTVIKVEKLMLSILVVLFVMLLAPAIVAFAIFGALSQAECPGVPLITWNLVYAIAGTTFVLIGCCLLGARFRSIQQWSPIKAGRGSGSACALCRTAVAYAGVLIGLFLFAWFAVGLVWLTSTSITDGCDENLYNATRGFLLTYVLAIFCCFASICSVCCLLCKPAKKKAKAKEEVEEMSSMEEVVEVTTFSAAI